jgi:sugar (pentulose or hexulose) kinase
MKTIIVPGDGASNIKISVYDFETLETVFETSTTTPAGEIDGYKCNHIKEEFDWFDKTIQSIPENLKNTEAISPVTRGASAAMIGENNIILDTDDGMNTIAYTQPYPDEVEKEFMNVVKSTENFFKECGSVASFPGSTCLIKRLFFEKIIRPEIYEKAKAFASFPMLIAGHFLDNNYLKAVKTAGNEHSYWMCHSGGRNIRKEPGTPSSLTEYIDRFWDLLPKNIFYPYKAISTTTPKISATLGIPTSTKVLPGGHDTCLSHIPIVSSFYKSKPEYESIPIFQLEAGTWTMGAQLGGNSKSAIPNDGYAKGIVVQGTVDGEATVTTMYGGGFDFREIKTLVENKGLTFKALFNENLLVNLLKKDLAFALPNINPNNYGTGPFQQVKGKIVNEDIFFSSGEAAYIFANLCITATACHQAELVISDSKTPIIITAGGSKDMYFGKLVATFTGRTVYAGIDKNGNALTETTSLGAAILGKAACLKIHPYDVDISSLGIEYNKITPFEGKTKELILNYRELFMKEIQKA